MSRLWVKICGLGTRESIEAAAAAGADAVGFVFCDASPRNLTIDAALELQRAVPAGVERVAVFRHPSQELFDGVVAALRPDWVQTDAADLAVLRLPRESRVLPVVRIGRALPEPLPARCLIEGERSGAGEPADWIAAAAVAARTQAVLAGGLTERNVREAVRAVRPFGVDVSSGVESSRGVKDFARIRDFIRAVRAAESDPVVEESR